MDVGTHPEWGALFNEQYFQTFFEECNAHNVNLARLWLHCDGRATPEFNNEGLVTGLDANFFDDLDRIFDLAEENDVMLMLCLWSFDMLKDRRDEAGTFAGNHHILIETEKGIQSYINNALIPIVDRYADRCNFFSIDIMNEPEWAIKGNRSAGIKNQVGLGAMQNFVGRIAKTIRERSDILITVGSASLKWNSPTAYAKAHYWSDIALHNATGCMSNTHLDFYSIHYWDWMHNKSFDPYKMEEIFFALDKPTIIGECPGEDAKYTVWEQYQLAFENNWAGIMPWSYNGEDGFGSWNDFKEQAKQTGEELAAFLDYECDPFWESENTPIAQVDPNFNVDVFPNPAVCNIQFNFKEAESITVNIYHPDGRFIFSKSENNDQITLNVHDLHSGFYLYEIIQTDGNIKQGKFLIRR